MTALRAQLGAALAKEADLLASLGARHPALAAAQAQTRDAVARSRMSSPASRAPPKVELDRAVESERQIARRVDQLTASQYAAGRASVELRELEREVESSVSSTTPSCVAPVKRGSSPESTRPMPASSAPPCLAREKRHQPPHLALLGGFAGGGAGMGWRSHSLLFLARCLTGRAPPARGGGRHTGGATRFGFCPGRTAPCVRRR